MVVAAAAAAIACHPSIYSRRTLQWADTQGGLNPITRPAVLFIPTAALVLVQWWITSDTLDIYNVLNCFGCAWLCPTHGLNCPSSTTMSVSLNGIRGATATFSIYTSLRRPRPADYPSSKTLTWDSDRNSWALKRFSHSLSSSFWNWQAVEINAVTALQIAMSVTSCIRIQASWDK